MTREEIISANPIADFLRNRGHDLKRAGENFVTSAGRSPQKVSSACHNQPSKKPLALQRLQSWRQRDRLAG